MSFDYYSYGDPSIAKKMFDAIVMMTNDRAGFNSLAAISGSLAFLFLVCFGMWRQSFKEVGGWFFAILFIWHGFFLPKTTVNIVSQSNTALMTPVSNVPLGVAFMGNVTSSIGKWFATTSDTIFTPINNVTYSNTGMVFGANSYKELRSLTLHSLDPELQGDLSQYMANCVKYDIQLYKSYTLQQLLVEPDLLTLIGNTKEALMTPVFNTNTKTYETLTCKNAYASIKQRFTAVSQGPRPKSILNAKLKGWTGNSGFNAPSPVVNKTLEQIESQYGHIFGTVSRSYNSIIGQEMMVNAIRMGAFQGAQMSGDQQQMATALASAQAEAQLLQQHNTAADIAAKYLPIASDVIEAILIAIFPFVLVISILAGLQSLNALLQYAMMLLWVKLWPGLFAVVNGIAGTFMLTQGYTAARGATATNLSNHLDILGTANTTQALAGYMTMLVPPIAYGLVKLVQGGLGSAFSQLTSSISATASSAGSSVGSGNVNIGNAKYNTQEGNAHTSADMHRNTGYAGTTVSNTSGGKYFQSNLPVSASGSIAQSQEYSRQASEAQSRGEKLAASAKESFSAATGSALEYAQTKGDSYSKQLMASSSVSAQSRRAMQWADNAAQEILNNAGVANDLTAKKSLAGKLGLGLTGESISPIQFGANAGLSQEQAQRIQTMAQNAIKAARSQGYSLDNSIAEAVQNSDTFKHDLSNGNSMAQKISSSMSQGHEASKQSSLEYGRSEELSAKAAQTWKDSMTVNSSLPINNQTMPGIENTDLTNPDAVSHAAQQVSSGIGMTPAPSSFGQMSAQTKESLNQAPSEINSFYKGASQNVSQASKNGNNSVRSKAGAMGVDDLKGEFNGARNGNQSAINNQSGNLDQGQRDVRTAQGNVIDRGAKVAELNYQNRLFTGNFSGENRASFGDLGNVSGDSTIQTSGASIGPKLDADRTADPQRTANTTVVQTPVKELRKLHKRR